MRISDRSSDVCSSDLNIPSYIRRKHGEEKPDYLHPKLEGILKETYGIMIYQEQVMQIAQVLSGYTLGSADLLRRAMGKKIKPELEAQRTNFTAGADRKSVESGKRVSVRSDRGGRRKIQNKK